MYTPYIWFGQQYLTLLVGCTQITYNNYSTIEIMKHSLITFSQLFYKYYIGFLCNYMIINYNNNNNKNKNTSIH